MAEMRPACREHPFILTAVAGTLYDACKRCKRLRVNGSEWRMRRPRTPQERRALRHLRDWRQSDAR